jgi:hypothetical protein
MYSWIMLVLSGWTLFMITPLIVTPCASQSACTAVNVHYRRTDAST